MLAGAVDRFGTSVAFGLASMLMLGAAAITFFSPLRSYDIRADPAVFDRRVPKTGESADTEPFAPAEEAETTAK
jgi:hypothetical protein